MKKLGGFVRFLLALVAALAILFLVAKALPGDYSITTLTHSISDAISGKQSEAEDAQNTAQAETTPEPETVSLLDPEATDTLVIDINGGDEEEETLSADEEPETLPVDDEEAEAALTEDEEPETGLSQDEQPEAALSEGVPENDVEEELSVPEIDPEDAEEEFLSGDDGEEDVSYAGDYAGMTTITISAAGDCTLGGDEKNGGYARFEKVYEQNGAEYFLKSVADIFEEDDLTIVNLEGALTAETKRKDKTFSFRGRPAYATILSSASVEAVSLDNNHSQDYYSQGLADTRKALKYVGVGYAGLGDIYATQINGVKIGMLSYRVWDVDAQSMKNEIAKVKQECDLVIVCMHWGDEKVSKANKTQIKLGHAAIDAGADLVLGTHPHVVGGIEKYNNRYIVYSLGNFCFGGNANPDDKDTFIFQITYNMENGKIAGDEVNVIPCRVSSVNNTNDYQPTPVSYANGGKTIIKNIAKLSQQFEATCDWNAVIAKQSTAE